MTRIKICGITNLEDAQIAAELGADALGFIFAPSPRQVSLQRAKEIIQKLPPFLTKVGVFVNEELNTVARAMSYCGLDVVQLHGEETPDYCRSLGERWRVIKSFRVKDGDSLLPLPDYEVSAYLLDTYVKGIAGGTGKTFNWELAREAKRFGRIILAGGLNPENITEAIETVKCYAVDVSSGIEAERGKKDFDKMRLFIKRAKEASLNIAFEI